MLGVGVLPPRATRPLPQLGGGVSQGQSRGPRTPMQTERPQWPKQSLTSVPGILYLDGQAARTGRATRALGS